jgi:hypothetical protein
MPGGWCLLLTWPLGTSCQCIYAHVGGHDNTVARRTLNGANAAVYEAEKVDSVTGLEVREER